MTVRDTVALPVCDWYLSAMYCTKSAAWCHQQLVTVAQGWWQLCSDKTVKSPEALERLPGTYHYFWEDWNLSSTKQNPKTSLKTSVYRAQQSPRTCIWKLMTYASANVLVILLENIVTALSLAESARWGHQQPQLLTYLQWTAHTCLTMALVDVSDRIWQPTLCQVIQMVTAACHVNYTAREILRCQLLFPTPLTLWVLNKIFFTLFQVPNMYMYRPLLHNATSECRLLSTYTPERRL